MAFNKIGFTAGSSNEMPANIVNGEIQKAPVARRSVVRVYFEDRNMTLSYYNDQFDLHFGDIVYVEGKLEGLRGRVTEVNYTFKIKLSDYKRVIAVVDTNVEGKLYMAGSHFVAFKRSILPYSKIVTWFKAPPEGGEDIVSGNGNTSFPLDDLGYMNVSPAVTERGHEYYMENRVRYISLDDTKGYAIVEGKEVYEIEFRYYGGDISDLVCSCFCAGGCKHEFAAMLQLRESIRIIEENYSEEWESTGYFAAISKGSLFKFAIDGKEMGSITL